MVVVVFRDLENHFKCNGSNFLSYRILQSFQSQGTLFVNLSKVRYPTVNRFLIRNSLPSTKRKADTKCTLCCYRRPAISYKLLNNKGSMFCRPRHGVHWKRARTPLFDDVLPTTVRAPHPKLYPLPNRGVLSAAPCTSNA